MGPLCLWQCLDIGSKIFCTYLKSVYPAFKHQLILSLFWLASDNKDLVSVKIRGRCQHAVFLAISSLFGRQAGQTTRQFNSCLLFALISLFPKTVIFPFQGCNHPPLQSVISCGCPRDSNLDAGQVAIFCLRLCNLPTPISDPTKQVLAFSRLYQQNSYKILNALFLLFQWVLMQPNCGLKTL